ncbi:tRNA (adenosine(37)-N6)-threonylcarbamoyltransferase complex transferase subunit TsaD [Spiroplasma endosymbiont of Othius punctulatus]|uniref:tRNA (adenosine(37)-N6)-threonylcarbamoyltransferase complex transferase subunit TsaD n=1 Tax=Spiroplasma endosymbiont of Othius punctulatus TaxID=3066289 RepID=UPI0030CCD953
MYILAIESSCDEFSVAVLKNEKVLSNIISSQIEDHKEYGGVVPELASRLHVQNFNWVLEEAIKKSNVSINELDYVVYTANPGLIGSLIIGKVVSQTLAQYLQIPLLPLNHLHGHVYSAFIDNKIEFPAIALITSGGHTEITLMKDHLEFEILGSTQDDAIGECFDKVAIKMGLSYPGGPAIDALAKKTDEAKYEIPKPKDINKYDFSFSGIKTASINLLHKLKQADTKIDLNSFAYSFQKTCVEYVIEKLEKAIKEYQPKFAILGGGVSANSMLRTKFTKMASENKIESIIPKNEYCTDNAAMIGMLGFRTIIKEEHKNAIIRT